MTVTITRLTDGASNTPAVISEWRSVRPSINRVHPLLSNQAPPAYDLNGSGWRSGSFVMVFNGPNARVNAFSVERSLTTASRFSLTDTKVPEQNLLFVVNGDVTLEASSTGAAWLITVPFQEIAA